METLDDIRSDAQDFLSEESRAKFQTRLSEILERQPNKALTLVFCGTFSSGKSSLINKLLQPKLNLPSGAEPVTKFVTRLKYGKEFSACYVWHGAEYALSLSDLKDVLTGKLALPDDSKEVIIRLNAKILRGGAEVLDTPGFLDNNELTEITRAAVNTADIALFVCNATAAGKEFEVDYFKELEKSIGNFCVIVNHMDSINLAKDFEPLKISMEGKVAGRGRAILHLLGMEKIFYTIAGGEFVNLGKLPKFFSFLCDGLTKKFRRRLQRYSYQRRTIHALQKLHDELETQIYWGNFFYSCAAEETEREYQDARKIYLTECKKIRKQLKNILTRGQKNLTAAVADIEREFDLLEDAVPVFEFKTKATAYLKRKLLTVPASVKEDLKKNFPAQTFDEQKFFKDYLVAVENYSVPEPVGKRKETGGKIISTILDALGTKSYDTIYENFSEAAKIHMREKLLDRLQAAIISCLERPEPLLKPAAPQKNDALLEEISTCLKKWEALRTTTEEHLTFCREKFFWDIGTNRKIFPMKGKFFPEEHFD